MSLVSNFIGEISSSQFGGISNIGQNFDINDTTFSDLLEKQMKIPTKEENNIMSLLGMPAGLQIQNIDGTDFFEKAFDQIEANGEKIETKTTEFNSFDTNQNKDITTSETVTFFSSLLDNSLQNQNSHSELFDFAKKQATNLYSKGASSVITDLEEFVTDVFHS